MPLFSSLLQSAGFVHGFSARSWDFADPHHLLEKEDLWRQQLAGFCRELAIPAHVHQAVQVHGTDVIEAAGEGSDSYPTQSADALIARDPGIAVGIRTADCVPILLANTATGEVAAVHAGWRGVVADIPSTAVAMLLRGANPAPLIAAIFPNIGPCCFEVGEEVAGYLQQTAPVDGVVVRRDGTIRGDLRLAVRAQLLSVGITNEAIEDIAGCTVCSADGGRHAGFRHHSFRRDGANSGRHLAAIAAR